MVLSDLEVFVEDKIQLYGDGKGHVTLINYMGTDKDIVNSARVSFNKEDLEEKEVTDKDKRLIRYLAKNKHTSPFEHCTVTFRVKVPLFVARQHMRHRTWSFNEISRRYTSENIEFYTPTEFRTQHKNNRQASNMEYINPVIDTTGGTTQDYVQRADEVVLGHSRRSYRLYLNLLEVGVSREQARMVLPQSMYTEYWCTANLLNIIKFLKLRLAPDAQAEIRDMAEAMAYYIKHLFPEAYAGCINVDLL